MRLGKRERRQLKLEQEYLAAARKRADMVPSTPGSDKLQTVRYLQAPTNGRFGSDKVCPRQPWDYKPRGKAPRTVRIYA